MKWAVSALTVVALAFLTQCAGGGGGKKKQQNTPVTDAAFPVAEYTGDAAWNDTARFLAGLPATGPGAYNRLRHTAIWTAHQQQMDAMFASFGKSRQSAILGWQGGALGGVGSSTVFYPFSGPDFLYAHVFFPRANRYILAGLESPGSVPDVSRAPHDEISAMLGNLRTSLKSNVHFSYFITKDMKTDLGRTRMEGSLPLVLVFLARTGYKIQSVRLIDLSADGAVVGRSGGGAAPGFHIVANGKNIYYFQENLADSSLGSDKRLLRFVQSQGAPVTFLKSASYLMHSGGFATIRNAILDQSRAVVQDPSGVPFNDFVSRGWKIKLYGNYSGTLDLFKEYYQPDLAAAYRDPKYQSSAVNFGIGYEQSPLIVATRP